MPDASRDLAPHQPIRLADYQAPAFLIDEVDLVFELGEEKTSVKARLSVRRNPAVEGVGRTAEACRRELELVSLAIDGEALGPNRYVVDDESLTIASVPDAFTLDIETRIEPQNNTRAVRPLHVRRQFLHPMRARGLPPHHLFPRPARRDGALHHDDRRRQGALSGAAVERQSRSSSGERRDGRHWAKWVDPHPKPSYLFALVAGDLVPFRDSFTTALGQDRAARDLGAARRRGQMRATRWNR